MFVRYYIILYNLLFINNVKWFWGHGYATFACCRIEWKCIFTKPRKPKFLIIDLSKDTGVYFSDSKNIIVDIGIFKLGYIYISGIIYSLAK